MVAVNPWGLFVFPFICSHATMRRPVPVRTWSLDSAQKRIHFLRGALVAVWLTVFEGVRSLCGLCAVFVRSLVLPSSCSTDGSDQVGRAYSLVACRALDIGLARHRATLGKPMISRRTNVAKDNPFDILLRCCLESRPELHKKPFGPSCLTQQLTQRSRSCRCARPSS